MRAVVQRVARASVSVEGSVLGHCGRGLLLLVAAHREDDIKDAAKLAEKVATLRIFGDADGKMNLSLKDLAPTDSPQILAVSNFTVYGDASSQRRPSFMASAPYADGERLFGAFVAALQAQGLSVETGRFGADMQVELVNDGPVTVILDVPAR